MAKPAILDLMGEVDYIRGILKSKYVYYRWAEVEGEAEAFFKEKGESIRGIVTSPPCRMVSEDMVSRLPNLEIVANFGVGLNSVDLQCCKRHGVVVVNTPDVLTDAVAETAIALLLATVRHICAADRFVREGKWRSGRYPLTTQVSGKRVGIVGLGRIGGAIAKRAAGFGCSIGYWGRAEKKGVEYKYFSSIVELANDSDFLILACALTEGTTKIVNREVLDALGPKGYLVNIARGLVVDEAELVSALTEGRLAGAGLDVFEKEPDVPQELLGMDNVVLQPHLAAVTAETLSAIVALIIANLEAHFSGKPAITPVSL